MTLTLSDTRLNAPDEFRFSNSNFRRVADLAALEAFGGSRDVNSTTNIKE